MTVNTISSIAEFDTNGVTTNFPFYFKFLANEDLVVTYVDPLGVSSTLNLGTHYTVNGAGNDQGGSVVTTSALAGPGQLVVSREMEAFQQTSLRNQGKFLAETHEDVFDKLTMLIQQGLATFTRALKRPLGRDYFFAENRRIASVKDPVEAQDAATRGWSEKFISDILETGQGPVNNAANVVFVNGDSVVTSVQNGVIKQFSSVANLRQKTGAIDKEQALLCGYYAAAPGVGGGELYWDAGSTASDNGGTVFAVEGIDTGRWIRKVVGEQIEAAWWGSLNSSSINSAVSFAYTNTRLRTVHLCGGEWSITDKISVPTADLHIIGDGQFTTRLTAQAGLDYIFDIGNGTTFIDNISIKSMTLNGAYTAGFLAHIRSRRCQKKFTIHDIECMDGPSGSTGLLISEGWGLSLTNSHFYFCGRALDLSGVNSANICGNYCRNNSRENLVLSNTSNAFIAANAFEHWGKGGIGSYYNINFSGNCFANRFNANWLESGDASNSALNIDPTSAHNSVEQNTIYCANGVGHLVFVRGSSNTVRHNRLSISNVTYAHVRVEAGSTLNEVGDNSYGGTSSQVSDGTSGNYFSSRRYVYRAQVATTGQTIANLSGVTLPVVSVPNVQPGMHVCTALSVTAQGCKVFGWVSAADTVTVRIENNTGAAVTLAAGALNVHVEQH